jgi:hypothetical protein
MNADSAFHIGATHAVCQDYAVAGNTLPDEPRTDFDFRVRPYVILSDGCSASPDTDIGARLLVKAAEQLFRTARQPTPSGLAKTHRKAARRALMWAEVAGLRAEALDATLLTAHLDGDTLVVGCSGDGVIFLQSRTGAIDVYVISYASGYPLYPSYTHQPARLLAHEDQTRDSRKEVTHFRCASAADALRLEGTSTSELVTEVFNVKASDYTRVALLSDGVHSFFTAKQTETSKNVEAVPLDSVLRELVAFKSVRGAFVARRMKRFVKDCQTRGWQHMDDLSVAALHLGD